MIPQFLLPRYFKWIGLFIYCTNYIYAIGFAKYETDDVNSYEGLIIQTFAVISLIFMLCARLKIEDEFSQLIRLISLQWAIILFILYRLGFKFLAYFFHDETFLPKGMGGLLLLMYLVLFYSQVYFLPWLKSKFIKNEE